MATADKIKNAKSIVIKIGSSLIVDEDATIRQSWLKSLVDDIAILKSEFKDVIVVTSGAIALGKIS